MKRTMKTTLSLASVLIGLCAGMANATVLYSENFDGEGTANNAYDNGTTPEVNVGSIATLQSVGWSQGGNATDTAWKMNTPNLGARGLRFGGHINWATGANSAAILAAGGFSISFDYDRNGQGDALTWFCVRVGNGAADAVVNAAEVDFSAVVRANANIKTFDNGADDSFGTANGDQARSVKFVYLFDSWDAGAPVEFKGFVDGSEIANDIFTWDGADDMRIAFGGSVAGTLVDNIVISTVTNQYTYIANSGFEANSFSTYPGTISGNSAIPGWAANDDSRVGLNPAGGTPFANNGAIPEGANVAFIQGSVGQTNVLTSNSGIKGLTVGKTYNLTYRLNNRNFGSNDSEWGLIIGGTKVLRSRVNAVANAGSYTAPYKYISYNFVATNTTMSLALDNTSLEDDTILVDDFVVTEVTPKITVSPWNDDATAGMDTPRSFTHAYNFGGAGLAPNATINGVTFTGVSGATPSVAGKFSYNMSVAYHTSDANNITGNSASLADCFVYGTELAVLTLEGLEVGVDYRTTIYTAGFGGNYGRSATITSPEGEMLTVDAHGAGDNNGRRIDIEFTASATSEDITLRATRGSMSTFHTYAFANSRDPQGTMIVIH